MWTDTAVSDDPDAHASRDFDTFTSAGERSRASGYSTGLILDPIRGYSIGGGICAYEL
jgi:vancomycin resistance protein YoaR